MKTPITYYGGKQKMVSVILRLIPPHKRYIEPFAGGAAVYFAKPKSDVEVLNDLNGHVVNFYKVCKESFGILRYLIMSTPYSRKVHRETEFILKNADHFNEVKRAWAFWVQTNMSFSSMIFGGYGFEKRTKGTVRKIINKKLSFTRAITDRLSWTDLECNDAIKVITSRDTDESFFYIDPPYFNSDCGHYNGYSVEDFKKLLETIKSISGKFLLSSYPSPELEEYTMAQGWHTHRITKKIAVTKLTDRSKVEVLTANYDINSLLRAAA